MNYQKHYDLLMSRARARTCPEGYVEKHHVVPKCLGGSDDPSNLVILTAREHYVAHQLLVKLNPSDLRISYAALMMTRLGKSNGRVNNRYYSWLKENYSRLQSMYMKERLKNTPNVSTKDSVRAIRKQAWLGENNPCYGKPNWDSIRAASAKTKGVKLKSEHAKKISEAIKLWHKNNPDKHPMKNRETLEKAISSRRLSIELKKEKK